MPVIYLDESGVLNNHRQHRFFVIGALVTEQDAHRKKLKNLCKRFHVKYCVPNNFDEIHAKILDFSAKQQILKKLNKLGCFYLDYIVVDKKHLKESLFKEKNICYNFLVAQLIKKIIRNYEEPVKILLDNHTIKAKSLNSLRDYVVTEARAKWDFTHAIEVLLIDSKDCKGVQLVDVVSNSIFARYNYNKEHLYNLNDPNFRHRIRFPYQKFGKN